MMTYSRKELKIAGKSDLNGKWGVAIAAALLAMLVPSFVLSFPEGIVSGASSVMLEYGAYETGMILSMVGSLFTLAFTIFIMGPLSIGYYAFTLRLSRGDEVTATTPYRVFTKGFYGRFTLAFFMMNLFITLWSLLFVIPGIVKSYSYYLMPYILSDHPEMGWSEAINESKRMMHGHKMDLFVLQMSFLGWILLSCLTFGILLIYVIPYMQQTEANFYRMLKAEQIKVQRELPAYQ